MKGFGTFLLIIGIITMLLFNVVGGGIVAAIGLFMIMAGRGSDSPSPAETIPNETIETALNEAKELLDKGTISQDEYEAKRKKILDID